jgi:lipopolysaccharide/colanic/teichoic acid biosynthesis glycosyltransferase
LYKREEDLLAASSDPERDYIEKILPQKLKYYEEYARQRTLWRDMVLILRTLKAIVV